ncbi:MAG: hypothetical protein ABI947_09505 [Chloroflexota bacterium]
MQVSHHLSRTIAILMVFSVLGVYVISVVPSLAQSQTQLLAQSPDVTPTATSDSADSAPAQSNQIYPTVEALPTVGLAGDKFTRVTISDAVLAGIGKTWLSFINVNDKPTTITPGTPTPANQIETVYIAAPSGGTPIKVIDLPATTGQQVFWSPNGAYLAYFVPTGSGVGLYILDLKIGLSLRLFELEDLSPRGIPSLPTWSPDSAELTISLATDYDVDIYSINVDGTNFRNLTSTPAFDFWPTWSPDGQYLAFVSDRAQCPTWIPNEPGSCYRPDFPTPDGGNLYVMEAQSGQVRKLSDEWVTAPPHWISASRLSFTAGKRGDSTAGSALWWVDLRGGPAHRISDDTPGLLITRDSWSADGRRVVYQEADAETRIVIRDDAGTEIARSTQLNFPRVAFAASWSPDGKRLVMGGRNAQCPYGMLLTDDTFKVIKTSSPNPGVCDPSWSPDGRYIAFNGVTQTASGTDGRFDVYLAEASGVGGRNLTGRLGGQIRLLGWVNFNAQQ